MENYDLQILARRLKSDLLKLPPFKIPYFQNEKWVLLSVSPPIFPGWVECSDNGLRLNPYGRPINPGSLITINPTRRSEVNEYVFTFEVVSYYKRILKMNTKVVFRISSSDGNNFKVINGREEQIFSVSYNYPIDNTETPIDQQITSTNIVETTSTFGRLNIPPYSRNTCFNKNASEQVYTYWGCYDQGYDGGDYNYKEGYISLENWTLTIKFPDIDVYLYNGIYAGGVGNIFHQRFISGTHTYNISPI